MAAEHRESPARQAPLAQLERTFIDEYLRTRGYDPATLASLPEQELHAVLADASVHASARLTEIESRSRLLHDIHGEPGTA
jgi:hypothetical protein